MKLIWVPVVLVGLTLFSSAFFFVLHLSTNEQVPLHRARILWRWTVVLVLGSFDLWIFTRVVQGLIFIWWPNSPLGHMN